MDVGKVYSLTMGNALVIESVENEVFKAGKLWQHRKLSNDLDILITGTHT